MIPYGPKNILRPVRIGKGAWIGLQVLILPGVDIGEGSVIAAGSVVRNTVPPFSIVKPSYSVAQPLGVEKCLGNYYRALP